MKGSSVQPSRSLTAVVERIVWHEPGPVLTRTKLVKLVYLVDRQSVVECNRQFTGVEYVNYFQGPYADPIIEAVEELHDERLRITSTKASMGRFFDHHWTEDEPPTALPSEEREIVDSVVAEFGEMDTADLVEWVQDLPEVKSTQKYGTIRFDAVRNGEEVNEEAI